MPFLPLRRWFQFRLSTWFVLVAILAWAMTCRPWWKVTHEHVVGHGDGFYAEYEVDKVVYNKSLIWPALALATFLAWKTAWTVVEHRRRQSAATE